MKDIEAHCSYCDMATEELKLVRENNADFLACYTCRQYRRSSASAIQAVERKSIGEVSYASVR